MMRKNILYKLFLCLLTCVAAVSCSDDGEDSLLVPPREGVTYLTIRTKVIGGTDDASRAEEAKEYEDNELKILRVLILQPDGATTYKVEHNVVSSSGKNTFKVKSNEKKLIYLLGNVEDAEMEESSAETWRTLQRAVKGQQVKPEDIDELVLKGYGRQVTDKDNPLPMTAKHELTTVLEKDNKTDKMECTLYIVPVANKLELTFQNKRITLDGDIIITGWSLDQVADCSYLLPHVDETTFEANKQTTGNWMQWMKDKCEATEMADAWLTEYSIPSITTHNPYVCTYDKEDLTLSATSKEPTSIPPIYIPESQYNQNTNNGLQQYTLHVTTKEEGETKTYSALLPNLGSLFRDTHVKIDVTFNEAGLSLEVDLYPYTGVDLDPDFGIDVPAEGGTETPGEQN